MDRNARAKIMWQAERREVNSKQKGKRNGDLGATGLTVLRALLFRFAPNPTPSYAELNRFTGLSLQALADAIGRLEAAGIVWREHRSYRTPEGFRRASNRYHVRLPLLGQAPKISKESKKLERFVPYAQLTGPLKDALEKLGRTLGIEQRPAV